MPVNLNSRRKDSSRNALAFAPPAGLLGGMSTVYTVEERAGRTVDVLTDETSGTRLIVARLGAEPVSLARRNARGEWIGFLYRDGDLTKNSDGWNNHATVMGYYVHRLKDEHTTYRGHPMQGGTHSFLRHKTFAAPEVKGHSITYTMPAGGYGPEEYPYRVQLKLTYTLGDNGVLLVRFDFTNQEPAQTVHVSFGLHPGFAVASLAEAQVLLPAGTYRRHLAPGNFLSGETVDIPHPGGPMPFSKAELPDSFLLEPVGLDDKAFTLVDQAGGRQVILDCPEAPYLTLWSDGHDFLCMEPCWGLPDAARQVSFEQKLGIQMIEPGGMLEQEFTIRPSLI